MMGREGALGTWMGFVTGRAGSLVVTDVGEGVGRGGGSMNMKLRVVFNTMMIMIVDAKRIKRLGSCLGFFASSSIF